MRYSYVAESHAAHEAYDPFAVAREPFPAPVATSRVYDTCTFVSPAPVPALAEFAREHSWEVRAQYSRGHLPHAITGRPSALKDLIALRFGAHPMTERQAYAVYARSASGGAWAWGSIMIWGPDLPPFAGCDLTALKDFLGQRAFTSAGELAIWVAGVKKAVACRDALQKRRDVARKRIRQDFQQFSMDQHAMTWPARLLAAYQACVQIRESVADIYTQDEVVKIIESAKSTDREGRR